MAEFTHRQDRPGPSIRHAEVRFPDEHDLGTGTYTVAVEPSALAAPQPIAAVLINRPVFQLALEVNPQSREAVVTFGRADGAEPVLQSVYRLPPPAAGAERTAPGGNARDFVVTFEKWTVRSLKLDGQDLEKIGPAVN
jgi:hypothetical protein